MVKFASTRMACEGGIVIQMENAFLQRVWDDYLVFRVDCTDEKAVVIMSEGELLPLVKTATDFSAQYVIVLGREQFGHSNFFDDGVLPFFKGEKLVTIGKVLFDEVRCCVEVEGFEIGFVCSVLEEEGGDVILVIIDGW